MPGRYPKEAWQVRMSRCDEPCAIWPPSSRHRPEVFNVPDVIDDKRPLLVLKCGGDHSLGIRKSTS